MNEAIGVFDSGIGGLSVLKKIREQLPNEDLIYVADSGHAPYGNKPREFIEERAFAISNFLLSQNIKALVVACNTATYAVAEQLRAHFAHVPIFAMEPGIKPAVLATQTGVIGTLATESTLSSEKFKKLVDEFAADKKVLIQPCYGLVELIERGDLTSQQTRELLEKYIQPLLAQNVDTLVLGCTHYPFVQELITDIAGKKVTIIETGEAVAKHVRKRLTEQNQLNNSATVGQTVFWGSVPAAQLQPVIEKMWGKAHRVNILPEDYL
jgi:glutamate racemase